MREATRFHAAAALEQEAPEEQDGQDNGERDDDDLNETHGRSLLTRTAKEKVGSEDCIVRARKTDCQRSIATGRSFLPSPIPTPHARTLFLNSASQATAASRRASV